MAGGDDDSGKAGVWCGMGGSHTTHMPPFFSVSGGDAVSLVA